MVINEIVIALYELNTLVFLSQVVAVWGEITLGHVAHWPVEMNGHTMIRIDNIANGMGSQYDIFGRQGVSGDV